MPTQGNTISLATPVGDVYLIGPGFAQRLKKLGISTVWDLLFHIPVRYEDFSLISSIDRLQPGEVVTICGTIARMRNEYTRGGKPIQRGHLVDKTGGLDIVWFNQPYLARSLREGTQVYLSGKVDWFGRTIVMNSPEHEILWKTPKNQQDASLRHHLGQAFNLHKPIHTARLVPIYPETLGVSSKWLRSRIASVLPLVLDEFNEYLPQNILAESDFMPYKDAVATIHFPKDKTVLARARYRLAVDELLMIQLPSARNRYARSLKLVGNRLSISSFRQEVEKFWQQLPFSLTAAQKRAVREIFHDLASAKPMNRLLVGDVGSGKTVVAGVAIYLACLNGFQSVLMAPTQILAQQHYNTLTTLLRTFGVSVELRTGLAKARTVTSITGKADVVVGTHAVLSEKLQFAKLGLVVIDEQQRFGVEQRALLRDKARHPHILTMTATPIPRTIALTMYGDLDLSYLDELPHGRKIVKTWVVSPSKRSAAYEWIRKQLQGDRLHSQVFIVCPLIEESSHETMQSVRAVKFEYLKLSTDIFPDFNVGLLHGNLSAKEKDQVLVDFRLGKLDILVTTPVVEVGIDIPSATIIVIEAAERFGLSQLHQLRGRVGRAEKQSYCILFSDAQNTRALTRLKYLEKNHIGRELAEFDLTLRGPGEIFGIRQHGVTELSIADITDRATISETQEIVETLMHQDATLESFPHLQHRLQRSKIRADATVTD